MGERLREVRAHRTKEGHGFRVSVDGKDTAGVYESAMPAWRKAVLEAAVLCGKTNERILVAGEGGAYIISPGVYPQP